MPLPTIAPLLRIMILGCVLTLVPTGATLAAPPIVESGVARAQIVISEAPERTVKLAAEELQSHIEKISGARLPIVTAPDDAYPVAIYVGQSDHTRKLGIAVADLDDGAFRIVSGENWLVLVGRDRDFVPPEPWAPHRGHFEAATAAWDEITGTTWSNPMIVGLFRQRHGETGLWAYDERGSLNAVYAWLRRLGVEWYMAGDLGTIIPHQPTIALPQVDQVVRPDFGLRCFHAMASTLSSLNRDDLLWQFRLGLNAASTEVGPWMLQSHGMRHVLTRDEMKAAHPEYYAMYNGERTAADRLAKPCLSSEGLFREHVAYLRTMFDTYDVPMLSAMPDDGFGRICECKLCEGKGTPERGYAGSMSDYVWNYVNRVAAELYKSHPDRKISCYAYGTYLLPPLHLDKLSPNLMVGIVHGRSGNFRNPETRLQLEQIRQTWQSMSPHDLLIWEHYVFTHRGTFWPAYFPHSIAEGLRALRGKSAGEVVEVAWGPAEVRGHGLHRPGFNHLNVYVTSRLYWDAEQDVDALLEKYYRDYYGPAAGAMEQFINYSEAHWRELATDAEKIGRVLELLAAAVQAAPPESPYAKRIALIADYLTPLHHLRDQLAKGREGVPEARAITRNDAPIELDGQLNESAWENLPAYRLYELQTGRDPAAATTFKVLWQGGRDAGTLTFGIRCDDPDMAGLAIAGDPSEPRKVFNGDNIELLLETQSHSYYQIVVGPNGTVFDLDRKGGLNDRWESSAKVATHIGDDHWTVEIQIPVTGGDRADDPLHDVIGRRPTESYPWFFNLCRQRVRGNDALLSAYSPTGENTFHVILKFAKLYVR